MLWSNQWTGSFVRTICVITHIIAIIRLLRQGCPLIISHLQNVYKFHITEITVPVSQYLHLSIKFIVSSFFNHHPFFFFKFNFHLMLHAFFVISLNFICMRCFNHACKLNVRFLFWYFRLFHFAIDITNIFP